MVDKGKVPILGVNVDVIDYDGAVERIAKAARNRQHFIVTAQPVHGIMTGARDPEHRYRLNAFDLLVPDGQPVRWAMNLLHHVRLRERVYGPNLMLALCERMAEEGLSIYLFGSRDSTVEKLRVRLQEKFPRLRIAGGQAGKFRILPESERATLLAEIRDSGASLTFVGLGCPRQEIWAFENRAELPMPLVCVGAGFDFHAGTVAQAPEQLQRVGLEWAFRLAKEPRRLWRRYVFLNPAYVGMVAAQAAGLVDYASRPAVAPEDTGIA